MVLEEESVIDVGTVGENNFTAYIERRNSKLRSGCSFRGFWAEKVMQFFLGLHLPKNDKKWFLKALGSLLWQEKNWSFSRHFPFAGQIHAYIAQIFYIFEKSEKSQSELRFHFEPDWRDSVGFCPFWDMMELKMEAFESCEKIKIFDILDCRFAAEAIIAHMIFCGILAISSIFDLQNAENRFLLKSPEKAWFVLHHTSIWAKSDRNSLIWLKMKSERSLQKQHFFSHFKH